MADLTRAQFEGCLLGLALGDALGAAREGGWAERLLWSLLAAANAPALRWSDDTQMSVDLAESLLACRGLDAQDLALRFAQGYRWSRGYGPGTARVLKRIRAGTPWREASRSVRREGSFGNGAAMRVPILGLYFAGRRPERVAAAQLSAQITHAHPLAIEGAVLIASATALAAGEGSARDLVLHAAADCTLEPYRARAHIADGWLRSGDAPDAGAVARHLGHGVAAADSCVTAAYVAARHLQRPFEEMQAFIVECGGDVDTLGAMAGAIWGAANGAAELPPRALARLEQRARLSALAAALHALRA